MKRTPVTPSVELFPEEFHSLLSGCPVFDSSCSPEARVWFLDRDGGLFLKSAPAGSLREEAAMTRYFHEKGLSAEVLAYYSSEQDWLLTTRIPGEDCTHPSYLADPNRLCDTTATLLRMLHDSSHADCPVTDRTQWYVTTALRNQAAGMFDASLFPGHWGFASARSALQLIRANGNCLKSDTLLHGDYCLPNVMLRSWDFSGFIDLGRAGVGDRHIDIFWGIWTLFFNLKTEAYTDRFLDAYGREKVEPELLRTVAAMEVFL